MTSVLKSNLEAGAQIILIILFSHGHITWIWHRLTINLSFTLIVDIHFTLILDCCFSSIPELVTSDLNFTIAQHAWNVYIM